LIFETFKVKGVSMQAKKKALLSIFLIIFIDLVGFGMIIPILPYYAESFGASATVLGFLMTAATAHPLSRGLDPSQLRCSGTVSPLGTMTTCPVGPYTAIRKECLVLPGLRETF